MEIINCGYIGTSTSRVYQNPFSGYYVYIQPQIYINGRWINPEFIIGGSWDSYGITAMQELPSDRIIIFTGNHGVTSGESNYMYAGGVTGASVRLLIFKFNKII